MEWAARLSRGTVNSKAARAIRDEFFFFYIRFGVLVLVEGYIATRFGG